MNWIANKSKKKYFVETQFQELEERLFSPCSLSAENYYSEAEFISSLIQLV